MAALSTAEKEQIFQIFGIPKGGVAYEVMRIADYFGPRGESYDFSALVTQLNSSITTLDAADDRRARVQTLLTEWDAITSYSELQVSGQGGSAGKLVDDPERRERIRRELSNLMGFYVPKGGYEAEIRRRNSMGNRFR